MTRHRCTTELERVRQQPRAAGSEPAAIAHAAREGAGVLAAWSVARDGDQPGPLAPAPRQLARSAELPARTPAPPKSLSRASGLALFMLAADQPDSTVGWLIVSRELGLRAGELGRVHRARGKLARAQEVEAELGVALAPIDAALQRERPARRGPQRRAQAAQRAREPLPPAIREGAGEVEDVNRLINPLRGRGRRGR